MPHPPHHSITLSIKATSGFDHAHLPHPPRGSMIVAPPERSPPPEMAQLHSQWFSYNPPYHPKPFPHTLKNRPPPPVKTTPQKPQWPPLTPKVNPSFRFIRKQMLNPAYPEVSNLPGCFANTANIIKLCPTAIFFFVSSLTRFIRPPDTRGICSLDNVHWIRVKVCSPCYMKTKSV